MKYILFLCIGSGILALVACIKWNVYETGFAHSGLQALLDESEAATPLRLVRTSPDGDAIADLFSCWLLQDLDDASMTNRIRLLYLIKVLDQAIAREPDVHEMAYSHFTIAVADFCRLCREAKDEIMFQGGRRLCEFYIHKVNERAPELEWNFQELMAFSEEKAAQRRKAMKSIRSSRHFSTAMKK